MVSYWGRVVDDVTAFTNGECYIFIYDSNVLTSQLHFVDILFGESFYKKHIFGRTEYLFLMDCKCIRR